MKILLSSENNIDYAANIIKEGGIVAFPTETVYGLGADGLNPLAVAKIFEAKNRPSFNPLILHINSLDQFKKISNIEIVKIEKLAENFWPGALTIVVPKKDIVPDIVTAGNETVAIRMPDHPVALKLIEKVGNPIAAPSANAFGFLSPTTAEHVAKQLRGKIDCVIDGGKCKVGVESSIIQIGEKENYILRHGGISKEDIEKVIGHLTEDLSVKERPNSPGQLPFHYAPSIPIKFFNHDEIISSGKLRLGGLFFSKVSMAENFESVKILSKSKNLREAASNLFLFLHEFEKEGLDLIFAEKIDEIGLGAAIMDRLKKAAKKYEM